MKVAVLAGLTDRVVMRDGVVRWVCSDRLDGGTRSLTIWKKHNEVIMVA